LKLNILHIKLCTDLRREKLVSVTASQLELT